MEIVTRAWSIDNKIAIVLNSAIKFLIIPKIITTTKTSPLFTGIAYIHISFNGQSTGLINILIDLVFIMKYYWALLTK